MVALDPNTSETSPWDVLNTFPKLHPRAREAKTRICTEAPRSKSLSRVEIWLVIYESRVGLESFTRDRIGFKAGSLNIYQYIASSPLRATDPTGLLTYFEQPTSWNLYHNSPNHGYPIRPLTPPVSLVPSQRGKCKIGVECVAASGVAPNITGRHCGVVTGSFDANGNYVEKHYHALGAWAPNGAGGCELLIQQPGLNAPSPYVTNLVGEYDSSVCDCLDRSQARINQFMKAGNDNYFAKPVEACWLNPQCNSNYSANCLLRGCGLTFTPPFIALGWGHRMRKCTYQTNLTCFGINIECKCYQWSNIDNGICEPGA